VVGAPEVVLRAARALEPRTDRYVYVSSCSVYPYPPQPAVDESVSAIHGDVDGV
jgi:nucleoside-diphosphate-sugar epimerase